MTDKTLQEVMQGLPTATRVTAVDNERYCGFVVGYSETGYGFGELEFGVDKQTGRALVHVDGTSLDHVGRILQRLVGVTVEGVKP